MASLNLQCLCLVVSILLTVAPRSLGIRIFNITSNSSFSFTESFLEWEIDYEGGYYGDVETLVCTQINQFFDFLYTCEVTKTNTTNSIVTNLRSGNNYRSCLYPLTSEAKRVIGNKGCNSRCDDIVDDIYRKVDDPVLVPGHNGSCIRYATMYDMWGIDAKIAVVVAAMLIFALIVSQVIEFACPKGPVLEQTSNDDDLSKSISADDDVGFFKKDTFTVGKGDGEILPKDTFKAVEDDDDDDNIPKETSAAVRGDSDHFATNIVGMVYDDDDALVHEDNLNEDLYSDAMNLDIIRPAIGGSTYANSPYYNTQYNYNMGYSDDRV